MPGVKTRQRPKTQVAIIAGFMMPLWYSSIKEEHDAVRNGVGLFDLSHMGEFFVSGPESLAWLNGLLTNDLAKLSPGEG